MVFTAAVVDVAVFTASLVTFRLIIPASPPLKKLVADEVPPAVEEEPPLAPR